MSTLGLQIERLAVEGLANKRGRWITHLHGSTRRICAEE
jgi:hypothetical protein